MFGADEENGPKPGLGPFLALGLVVYLMIALDISRLVVKQLTQEAEPATWSLGLGYLLGFVVTVPVVRALARRPWGELLPFRAFRPVVLPLALLLAGGLLGPLHVLGEALSRVQSLPEGTGEHLGNVLPYAILAATIAPLVEECMFRGLLLRGLIARVGERQAFWYAALLYAFCHLYLPAVAVALVWGLLLTWLAWRSGSLVPGMAVSAVVNLSPYLLAAVLETGPGGAERVPTWLLAGGPLVSLMAFALLRRVFAGDDVRAPGS